MERLGGWGGGGGGGRVFFFLEGPHRKKIIFSNSETKGIVEVVPTVANEIHHGRRVECCAWRVFLRLTPSQ